MKNPTIDDTSSNYVLQPCARFAHKRSYIELLAKEYHFKILALQTGLQSFTENLKSLVLQRSPFASFSLKTWAVMV